MAADAEPGISMASSTPIDSERVEKVIEAMRPAVQADGGDLELIGITGDGIVRVRLHGACVGCPSSDATLKMGIERNLRHHVPGVAGVEAIDE